MNDDPQHLAAALEDALADDRDVVVLTITDGGRVIRANAGARTTSQVKSLTDVFRGEDVDRLVRAMAAGERWSSQPVTMVEAGGERRTLLATTRPAGTTWVLVAHPSFSAGERANDELLDLTRELSVVMRENQRQRRELEALSTQLQATLDDLHESHWHLRKMQEVLPICLDCGKVRAADTATGEADWQPLMSFLTEHAHFLSHGFCPECLTVQLARITADPPEDKEPNR